MAGEQLTCIMFQAMLLANRLSVGERRFHISGWTAHRSGKPLDSARHQVLLDGLFSLAACCINLHISRIARQIGNDQVIVTDTDGAWRMLFLQWAFLTGCRFQLGAHTSAMLKERQLCIPLPISHSCIPASLPVGWLKVV